VRSDVAVETGGGEAGLWADRTRRLNRPPPHTANNLSSTLPRDETCRSVNCLISLTRPTFLDPFRPLLLDAFWPASTYIPMGSQPPSLTPPVKQVCHGNIQSAAENVGEGRERAASSKQQRLKWCLLRHWQSQCYMLSNDTDICC